MTNSSHSFLSGAPPLWALLSLASGDLSALCCCADMSRSPARSGHVQSSVAVETLQKGLHIFSPGLEISHKQS